ncbi:MAG: CBS domain-containing protein [Nanoarchaeota archaeon]
MVYFSQLKNRNVYDSKGELIGKLFDLVFIDGKEYAEIDHIIYIDEDKYKKKISWDFVREIKEGNKNDNITIHLNSPIGDITPFFIKKEESLVGDILDKQVIDVNGVKVVRINDIVLGKVIKKLCIVGVSVGAGSFVRRLGIFKSKKINDRMIPWKSVERLEPELHDLHLKIQKDKIADLHPEDIADIMEDLTHTERILIFNSLTKRKAAKTLIEAEEEIQDSFLKSFKMKKIKDLLEDIPTDQAADIMSLMPQSRQNQLLKSMKKEISSKIHDILEYYPESIGSIMKTEFIAIPKDYTAQQTISMLRKMEHHAASQYNIYVVDKKDHLIGFLSSRSLIISKPEKKINDIMAHKVITVRDHSAKETAARLMARYDLFIIPVIDKDGRLVGIVKSDDILEEYIPERLKREKFLPSRLKKQ